MEKPWVSFGKWSRNSGFPPSPKTRQTRTGPYWSHIFWGPVFTNKMPKRLMFLPFPYATHGAGIWIPTFALKITQLGKYTSTIFRIWDSLPLKDFRCLPLSDSRRGLRWEIEPWSFSSGSWNFAEGCWGYSRGSQSLLVNDFEANRKSLFEGGWSNMKQHEATWSNYSKSA